MANLILNLCVKVKTSGLQVSWGGSTTGAPTDFYFLVFRSKEDTPVAVHNDSVTLDGTQPARILVYDAQPEGSPPTGWYEEPTYIDPRLDVMLEGEGALTSGSDTNPWPPT